MHEHIIILMMRLVFGRCFSVVGGVIVIIGLYLLLWGKDRDGEYKSGGESFPTHNEEKESTTEKTVVVTSPQDDRPT